MSNIKNIPEIEKENKEDLRIRFITDIPYFGPGAAKLLESIEEKNSVSDACKEMGMSYSKGWKILKKIKAATGFDAVNCKQGGSNGGFATLSDQGKQLLVSFRAYENEVKQFAHERFQYYNNRKKDERGL